MGWITDTTGRFPKRFYFEKWVIDDQFEYILSEFFAKKYKMPFKPPIRTEDITVLIETVAESLDLYADLEATEGQGVEGVTEFRPNRKPIVKIDQRLSNSPWLINRLRTTLAHEFFHAEFHRGTYEQLWSDRPKTSQTEAARCFRKTILGKPKADWLEWQAGYGAGALLMPLSSLQVDFTKTVGNINHLYVRTPAANSFISLVADRYQVSKEAANVRLKELNFLVDRRRGRDRRVKETLSRV